MQNNPLSLQISPIREKLLNRKEQERIRHSLRKEPSAEKQHIVLHEAERLNSLIADAMKNEKTEITVNYIPEKENRQILAENGFIVSILEGKSWSSQNSVPRKYCKIAWSLEDS